jgi:predicted CoA-binding protein
MSTVKTTLVLGASPNPERVSYQALISLKKRAIPFIAVGKREYEDEVFKIIKELPSNPGPIHTVTLYLGPPNQKEYYDYIVALKPERIIFNPGTENPELADLASQKGIEVVEGCMLVMMKTGQY